MSNMALNSERTGLISGDYKPQYSFGFALARERKRRVRQFQCCMCVIATCAVVMAVVFIVSYAIPRDDHSQNSTLNNNTDPDFLNNLLVTISWPIEDFGKNLTILNSSEWKTALLVGEKALQKMEEEEKCVPGVELNSPSYKHQKIVATSARSQLLAKIGHIEGFATKYIHRKLSKKEKLIMCRSHYIPDTLTYKTCLRSIQCNEFHKYRSYDGTCNNLEEPEKYGVAFTPFRRALPPDYADCINSPRVSKTGGPLPSARTVSLTVHRPYYKSNSKFTVMLAVWGQFLDHDITATALSQGENGRTISCCNNRASKHPECFPVLLDANDPYYQYNISCMEFVRSAPAVTCHFGPREQMNQVTSFIDGSVIYGADIDVVNKLRTFENGTLKMLTIANRTLLPISEDLNDGCNREEMKLRGRYCFMTGDGRANENLHLTSMHLIWARNHNMIALKLSTLNPQWNDERLFQETRRILAAQMQHITYNEFLPILFGQTMMDKFNLTLGLPGRGYNISIDASIANNFATAAFRFAHTLIPGIMKFLSNDTSSPEYVQLHEMLLDPFKLYDQDGLDRSLRGAMNTAVEASDPFFTNELKQHLFETNVVNNRGRVCGLDLVSLNIQRGRDHGLPGYSIWRKYCGLQKPRNFDDLAKDIAHESLNNIRSIYRHVDDIDLYTGALSEMPLNESILGPTLTCLLLDQFVRLKRGDRFWYENSGSFTGFTNEQLREIKKSTLARVICDNSDNVQYTQLYVMQSVDKNNPNVPCTDISSLDLNPWKDTSLHHVLVEDKLTAVRTATPGTFQ